MKRAKTSKRRIPPRAVILFKRLKEIKELGLHRVIEPAGHKMEYKSGRYELCDLLGLREPWQSFPLDCDGPYPYSDKECYRARCHEQGWAARQALEDASR